MYGKLQGPSSATAKIKVNVTIQDETNRMKLDATSGTLFHYSLKPNVDMISPPR